MAITVSSFELPQAVGMTVISSDQRERVDYLLGVADRDGKLTVEVMQIGWEDGEQGEGDVILSAPLAVS